MTSQQPPRRNPWRKKRRRRGRRGERREETIEKREEKEEQEEEEEGEKAEEKDQVDPAGRPGILTTDKIPTPDFPPLWGQGWPWG